MNCCRPSQGLLLTTGLMAQIPPKDPPAKPADSKPAAKPAPVADSLNALIADALKHNPDIQAAPASTQS